MIVCTGWRRSDSWATKSDRARTTLRSRGRAMSTRQVLIRMAVYGMVLAAIDAVSGSTLQASPEPRVILSLMANALAAYRLAEGSHASIALTTALLLRSA